MKVILYGPRSSSIEPLLERHGLEIVDEGPDLVIAYGGDGALLGAEREFPGIPKYPIRDSETAPLCPEHDSYDTLLDLVSRGALTVTELPKLSGTAKQRELKAINDIFVHNLDRVSAIRYRVWIDGLNYGHEIVGDGVGVSTVHGSTAYYRSITHSIFRTGIGLAFSNSTEVTNHLVLPENSVIRIKVTRGPALMVADNNPETLELDNEDEIKLCLTDACAYVYGHEIFMCEACRRLRHPRD